MVRKEASDMPPSELPAPLIVVDDDQWMYVYTSASQLTRNVEPVLLDDIEAAFDGLARPLRFVLDETGKEVRTELESSETRLVQLQNHVDEFFASWTLDDPPEHLTDPREYTQEVGRAYARKRERHRKRT